MADNKNKKQHSPLQLAILFKVIAFIFLVAPMAALLIVKKDVYFIEGENVKLSIGCILTLIFLIFALLGKLKGMNSILVLAIFEILTYLMKTLVNDILIIIPCCMSGMVMYQLFDHFYKHYWEIHMIQRNAKLDQSARNSLAIEKEQEKQKLIFRSKKNNDYEGRV